MGDDTPAEAQPETKSQPQVSSQPPDEPPQSKAPDPVTEPPNDLTHKHPSTCKIPVRPNKLRKLSVKPSTGETRKTELPEEMLGDLSDGDSSKTLTVAKVSVTVTAKNKRRNSSIPARVLPIVIKPLSAEGEIDAALRHLRVADPLLVELIDSLPPPSFDSNQSPFLALTKSILYQQLAYKAGTSIYTRFVELCGGEDGVLPDAVLSLSCPQLRQIGVSARKATYLYDLANKFKTGILSDTKIVGMDDKSLFTMLSMVKGIGSWSVHMFMIFSLHRPDVLPVSDVGVRKGVQILNGLEELPRPSQMDKHCEKWKPYRSVGSWYMWRLVEGKGNQQAGAPMTLEGIMPLQQQQQEETQQQHQLQLLEHINGSANFG